MISFCIVDHQGTEIPIDADTIELEEARHYELRLAEGSGAARVFLGAVEIERSANGFPIPIEHWVGGTNLSIRTDQEHRSLAVQVHSRQNKLPDDLWIELLTDLEAWLPGVSVGAEGGKKGEVGSTGATAQLICEALNPLVPVLERALRTLLEAPREHLESVAEEISIRKVRRVGRSTVNWLGRHPEVAAWLDPWLASDLTGEPPLVPQYRKTIQLDHPANRYIAWLVFRVISNLRMTATELESMSNAAGVTADGAMWCGARAERLLASANRLERLWRICKLRSIPKQPLSEAALQVILDDPIYLRVHRLGRKFLAPRFRLRELESETGAAVRPSYSLYELWCFLELGRQLRSRLPELTWRELGHSKLLLLTGSGSGAAIEGVGQAGTFRLEFNPIFTGFIARKSQARWSISAERRPDFVVSWCPKDGEGAWVALDAKYRTGRQNLGAAFESIHIYRDSLRYEGLGDKCTGAILLAPSTSSDCAVWFSREFIREYRAGIWELRPGGKSQAALADWLLSKVGYPRLDARVG